MHLDLAVIQTVSLGVRFSPITAQNIFSAVNENRSSAGPSRLEGPRLGEKKNPLEVACLPGSLSIASLKRTYSRWAQIKAII